MDETLHLYGGPASPYSLKLRSFLRYRRIPHTWLVPQSGFTGTGALGEGDPDSPLNRAGKNVVPVLEFPDGSFKADSTPIMLSLESVNPERSIVHPHAGVALLAQLIEDMADEYLPFPMFYFRWTEDAEWCGRRQMIGWNGAMTDEELAPLAKAFTERQQGQLGASASLPQDQVEQNYLAVLEALEMQLQKSLFLFGSRPSLAEFGLFGQLTQYAVDPHVTKLMKEKAVRVFQWTQFMDDLSGIEGQWATPEDCLTPELDAVISSLAPGYFFMMQMIQQNHDLENMDLEEIAAALNGPRYRLKCLLSLKQALADLSDDDRTLIRPVLEQSGCWEALQFNPGEAEKVVAITPA
jgi:glutathione S-transferase